MSDSTLLNSLPKIYFNRKKNRGTSYVKAYDGNAWNADKGYAVKSIPELSVLLTVLMHWDL